MTARPTTPAIQTTLAPWLSVRGSARAVEFYKTAFGAVEVYRMEDPSGSVVSRLSIDGAEFWVADESPEHFNFSPETTHGATTRLILTVADPDALFGHALGAGAKQVYRCRRGVRLARRPRGRSVWAPLGDWAPVAMRLGGRAQGLEETRAF
jgi:PhnB protein